MDVPITCKAAILEALTRGPGRAFDLSARVHGLTNGSLALSQGSITPALRSLVDAGLIGGYGLAVTHYAITASGRSVAARNRRTIEGLFSMGSPARKRRTK